MELLAPPSALSWPREKKGADDDDDDGEEEAEESLPRDGRGRGALLAGMRKVEVEAREAFLAMDLGHLGVAP